MAGVFLSHSSVDKGFVTKLAIDLVAEGFPVWFDSWELETGAPLSRRIYDGLDDSDSVLVLLSPNSLGSEWVRKEIEGAMIKEERLGKTFVIPIKIADCEAPLQIAGKIYADLSRNYLGSLERLVVLLKKRHAESVAVPPERQLIPVIFTRGEHLNRVAFVARAEALKDILPCDYLIASQQMVVSQEPDYDILRSRLLTNIENLPSCDYYTPQIEEYLRGSYALIRRNENALLSGLAVLLNFWRERPTWFSLGESAYWFARIVRNILLSHLHAAQLKNAPEISDYGKGCFLSPTGDNHSAKKFYSLVEIASIDVFEPHTGEYMPVWIDGASEIAREFRPAAFQCDLAEAGVQNIETYIIPQILLRQSLGLTKLSLTDLYKLRIGPS
jgi:hypothetical protein